MFGLFKKKLHPLQPSASSLVPRIKHLNFLAYLKQTNAPEDQLPYTEPLVADLLITYAFDLPDMFMMATPKHFQQLDLQPAQLRELALNNLRRQIPNLEIKDLKDDRGSEVHFVVTGNNCEACALLATPFWNQLTPLIPGQIVAAVPNREVLLFCSSASPASIQTMVALSVKAYEEGGNHALTQKLLTWQNGVWAEYHR